MIDTSMERYNYAFDPDGDALAARLLRQLPAGGSVLELGPGAGAMTRVLLEKGYQVTVVENDPEALTIMQTLGVHTCVAANLEHPDWAQALEGQQFDAVLACDVLEHLRQPEQVLERLTRLLTPQGRLIISVPNVAYAGVVAGLCQGTFDYADSGILDRTHLRFFTQRSLNSLLLEHGWLPRWWDTYRVPLPESEFAWAWESLPPALRQALQSCWPDLDIYEWMVVATPAGGDAQGWELAQARSQVERLRSELYALKLVHENEHASLLEHQQAFAEARTVIANFENQVRQLQMQQHEWIGGRQQFEQAQQQTQHRLEQAQQRIADLSSWRRWVPQWLLALARRIRHR